MYIYTLTSDFTTRRDISIFVMSGLKFYAFWLQVTSGEESWTAIIIGENKRKL